MPAVGSCADYQGVATDMTYTPKPFAGCLAEIQECRENQRKYPDAKKLALLGELDWTEEHILSGGTIEELMQLDDAYHKFIEAKTQLGQQSGFSPLWMPEFLFPFQQSLVEWALLKGRAAIFADCGLGKTPMQLVWAQNIVQHENKPVLILTPLAVSAQTVREGDKFGIQVEQSRNGKFHSQSKLIVTNYEQLHHFDRTAFAGCVCDESGILKSFDGTYRKEITEFMRKMKYRLLCTATASPNDHIELGTHSEALGELGYMDMLNRFFKNDSNNSAPGRKYGEVVKWRFKGYAELPFWRWVSSWARAIRKPSDLGFDDNGFILPPLVEKQYLVETNTIAEGFLFSLPATDIREQREERKRTIQERCEKVLSLVTAQKGQSLIWCHLNNEGDLLENIIPNAVQVKGGDSDEFKEETFLAFAMGEIRDLVTKPKIGAWGLNFQNCHHETFFPSHSFEQYYQGVRRCWRFGQKQSVYIDVVTTEGEKAVLANMQRKSKQADQMFAALVSEMNNAIKIARGTDHNTPTELPSWL